MYHIHYGGETRGPYLIDQIRNMWATGIITADAVYWNETQSVWRPLAEIITPAGQERKQPPPQPPPLPLQQSLHTTPPAAGARTASIPGPPVIHPTRTRYAVINGLLGFGIPLVLGGLLSEIFFFPHKNVYAYSGYVTVFIPGCLWYGYYSRARQWDKKALQGNPLKSNGFAVAFLTIVWVPVILGILLVRFQKLAEPLPSTTFDGTIPSSATLPKTSLAAPPPAFVPPAAPPVTTTPPRPPGNSSGQPQIAWSKSEAKELLEKAHSYNRQGNVSEALAAYQKVVELDPDYQDAWFALGVFQLKRNHPNDAISALKKSAALAPDDPATQHQLILAYINLGFYTDANFARLRLERLDPPQATELLQSFDLALVQKFATLDYPDLAVENSPLNRQFVAIYNADKAQNAPILRHHDWPLKLAATAAAAIASARATAPQAPAIAQAPAAPRAPSAPPPAAEAQATNSTEVQMQTEGKSFMLLAQLNGAVDTPFVLDTGADYVCITEDVFRKLQAAGGIRETFSRPNEHISTANGSTIKADHFILQSIKVGEAIAPDVEAITYPGAQPLLGQTFLHKFKSFNLDNSTARLTLTGKEPEAPIPFENLEISRYVGQLPLGTAMLTQEQKRDMQLDSELGVMRKIETMGLYAVAIRTVDQPTNLADGSDQWVLEMGETFPFLGFNYSTARVKLGTTWFEVPRNAVTIVRLSEHPELARKHQEILRQARANQ